MPNAPLSISVIDSHTEGEPTRAVTGGFPSLQGASISEKIEHFRTEFDHLRSAIVNEPRGHSAVVGALLLPPIDPGNACGVIFFNNVGYLKMCGHGTIGVVRTLEFLQRIGPGRVGIETVAGTVAADLAEDGSVTIRNVPSFRHAKAVEIEVDGFGTVTGDIAWGGNWFFLIEDHPFEIGPAAIPEMKAYTAAIMESLFKQGITGADGGEIDHVELFGPSDTADSRNFVLCPGAEYDRSPCGTGTSAKVACLFEDGKLKEGEVWTQESVIGSLFEAFVEVIDAAIVPSIKGTAHIVSRSELIIDPSDPFSYGLPRTIESK